MWTAKICRRLLAIAATVLLGGFLSATLVRMAPGFDSDEELLDPRLNSQSLEALRAERAAQHNIFRFYAAYLGKAAHGNLGTSQTLNRPVRELIGERLPLTLRLVGVGLLLGWMLALSLAMSAALARVSAYEIFASSLGGFFLCIPAAVMALFFVYANAPAYLAIALIVFPNVFRYTRNLLDKSYQMPHILTARAKGMGEVRILLWHVLLVSGGQLLALAGVSVSMALGAAIPVEALCGVPGVGQLAWQAATARDLPLLVTITVLVTVITLVANSSSELAGEALRPREAA